MTPAEILDRHFGYDAANPQWITDQLVLAGDLRTIEALEATPRHMGLQSGDVLDRWLDEPVVTFDPLPVSPLLRMVALGSFAALCVLAGALLLGWAVS